MDIFLHRSVNCLNVIGEKLDDFVEISVNR